MPIFETDPNGTPRRWTSKADLRTKAKELAALVVEERHETIRLRQQVISDTHAWDYLKQEYAASRAEVDDLKLKIEAIGLALKATEDALHVSADYALEYQRVARYAKENVDTAQGEMARLILERDEARAALAQVRADWDADAEAELAEDLLEKVYELSLACQEVDEERMAREGRHGRLGTPRIRAIFGWES